MFQDPYGGKKHLQALRVQLVEPVLPERIFPSEFLPQFDNPSMQHDYYYVQQVTDNVP